MEGKTWIKLGNSVLAQTYWFQFQLFGNWNVLGIRKHVSFRASAIWCAITRTYPISSDLWQSISKAFLHVSLTKWNENNLTNKWYIYSQLWRKLMTIVKEKNILKNLVNVMIYYFQEKTMIGTETMNPLPAMMSYLLTQTRWRCMR